MDFEPSDQPEGHIVSDETRRLIRRQQRRALWGTFLVMVFLLVMMAGSTPWIRNLLQGPLIVNEPPVAADAIIVLGVGTKKSGDHLGPQAKQRVLEGINLLKAGIAPRIIFSGGVDTGTQLIEAEEMATFAESQGMSPDVIIQERRSTDTYQNAKYSLDMMAEHNWFTAIVVTSPYHTWRACRIFRAQQASVRCVAAPYTLLPSKTFLDRLDDTKSVIREYGAIIVNKMRGQI